jgi:hypothetical protein
MRWTIKSKPEKEKVQALQNALQVDEIIATLLVTAFHISELITPKTTMFP